MAKRRKKHRLPDDFCRILQDEKGKWSTSRIAFWILLCNILGLVWLDALRALVEVPNAAYALLGGLMTAVVAWAAGPRIAQYVGPQIGSFASGIANAAQRLPLKRPIDAPQPGQDAAQPPA